MIFISRHKCCDYILWVNFCSFNFLSLHVHLNVNVVNIPIGFYWLYSISFCYCATYGLFNHFLLIEHLDWSHFFSIINSFARLYLAGITRIFPNIKLLGQRQEALVNIARVLSKKIGFIYNAIS